MRGHVLSTSNISFAPFSQEPALQVVRGHLFYKWQVRDSDLRRLILRPTPSTPQLYCSHRETFQASRLPSSCILDLDKEAKRLLKPTGPHQDVGITCVRASCRDMGSPRTSSRNPAHWLEAVCSGNSGIISSRNSRLTPKPAHIIGLLQSLNSKVSSI